MSEFLLKQFSIFITTIFGITLITFSLIHLTPGDPILLLAGESGVNQQEYEALAEKLGLNENLFQQYFAYITQLIQGDLGKSIITGIPVLEEFTSFFPATFELVFTAMFIALVIGIPLGVFAALKQGSYIDYAFVSTSLVGYSMPIFWWGMLLILLFSLTLGWTPVAGRLSYLYDIEPVTGFMLIDTLLSSKPYATEAFIDALHHLLLPAIVLGTVPLAVIMRMTRSSMLEVLSAEYIRTAKAKNVPYQKIIWLHAFRNALIPIITVVGLQTSILLTGSILTESIFAWPGVGKWILEAIYKRDYPVIQGGILLVSCVVVLLNTSLDLLNASLNPRLRKGS